MDGKPLAGAKVLFTPNDGNKPNTPGVDTTGQEGNFKLMYRGRSGVSPGKYSVLIAKTIEPPSVKVPEEFKDDPMLAGMARQQALISQAAKGRKQARGGPHRRLVRSGGFFVGRSLRLRRQGAGQVRIGSTGVHPPTIGQSQSPAGRSHDLTRIGTRRFWWYDTSQASYS